MPSTRNVLPCFARPRFQLGLSSRAPPNELDRHGTSGHGLHSSRCTRLNCEVLCIVQLCFTAASTESAWTKSDVISQTMHVVSLLRNCPKTCGSCSHAANKPQNCNQLSRTSDMADVSPSSKNRTCPLHHIGACRCITTSTSTTQSRNCTCRTSTSSELSGWSALGVASPLAHRQFGR